ncbi:MAG: AAA family ATPase [Anaerolineales bacterium]|nr:AAA family ATPase [Anaerolineales bacterium]
MPAQPRLIVVGGFAGAGKSTLAKNIGRALSLPVFEIDQMARSIQDNKDFQGAPQAAYRIAFDLFFLFAQGHLQNEGSLILDQNMGHRQTWQNIETLKTSLPHIEVVIFLLDCPYDLCVSRVAARTKHPNLLEVTPENLHNHKYKWDFLHENELPEAIRIDATRPATAVFQEVMHFLNPKIAP